MSDPLQEQLLGHLLGALEESEQEQIAARLQGDAALRLELARVRGRLESLESGRRVFTPPPGLAERTCRAVASHADSSAAARRRPMSPADAAPGSGARFSWVDVAVAAAILAAVSLLTVPAIQSSRFNAQLVGCQDNLWQLAVGMKQYSQQHDGYFPSIPTRGELSGAVVCAPMLVSGGFVTDSRWFICPGSSLAGRKGFRISSLEELQTTSWKKLSGLPRRMVGSYGYPLGYTEDGVYHGTRDLGRAYFALVADIPGSDPSNGRQSLNHGGLGQNVLFECGGVRFVTSPRPDPRADHIYINDRGFMAPGLHYNDSVIGPSNARPFIILISR
ncbi:MAG: hypothetical protein ACYSWU_07025 [Planctomycetota bacterium]|jgi:hypothetical protein